MKLKTKNQLFKLPRSALKVPVPVVISGVGWLKVNLVIDFGYYLALAKPNNITISPF